MNVHVFAWALLLVWLWAPTACAEIYTWTDAQGRVHMADDLSKVPPEHRKRASGRSRKEIADPRGWNALPAADAAASPEPEAALEGGEGPRVHVLSVERAGREMRLAVELDGGARVPFVVDTGAMICTIPLWAVQEMGIEFDEDTPSMLVRGISGKPMLVPVVTFRSVRVGEAEVEDLEMAVLSTQRAGLLGMTFFNHFKVSTDPTRGTLTLEEIDLDSVDGVYGGLGERAWRSRFAYTNGMLERMRGYREQFPAEYTEFAEKLERAEEYWEHQLDELELKASRAGVPRAWRE